MLLHFIQVEFKFKAKSYILTPALVNNSHYSFQSGRERVEQLFSALVHNKR